MSKRVANKHGQPSRNRMCARGVKRAVAQAVMERRRAKEQEREQEQGAQVAAKEISTLKKQLATPPEKAGVFRSLLSRRGT